MPGGAYRLPKPRTPTIFRQPWERTLGQKEQPPPYGTPPEEWTGSVAEWAVAWALESLGEEYHFQYPWDGGRLILGGTILDFYIPARMLVIRVQGLYWHYYRSPLVKDNDALLKSSLESNGLVVIDIDEDHALAEPIYYVTEALAYHDHSRAVTGI